MTITFEKPEDWGEDWTAETGECPSWEYLAEQQLKEQFLAGDLNELNEGDVLAMQDRNCITQEWPRRVFVLIGLEHAYIYDESGKLIDEPSNFVCKGQQPLRADGHGFIDEWTGEQYYRIPPLAAVPPAAAKGAAAAVDAAATAAQGAALCAMYSAELEASTVDEQFPATLLPDPSPDAAVNASPAPAPTPAEGSVIQVYNGERGWEKCFVFKASKSSIAVVYTDRAWEGIKGDLGIKWSPAEDAAGELPSGAT